MHQQVFGTVKVLKRFWYGSGSTSGSVSLWYGPEDSDPCQYVTDPEHCGLILKITNSCFLLKCSHHFSF
jgi:hypothetical protein